MGVVGARGGVGASVLAALLAAQAAERTATVVVDLCAGAGLDVLLGLETVPGPRWPDLVGAGDVAGAELLAALPRWGRCAVLSADRERPAALPGAEVLDRLGEAAGAVVLDLSRAGVLADPSVAMRCHLVVVVVGRDAMSAGGAVALRVALGPAASRTGLVVRDTGGLSVAEMEQATALPLLGRVPRDRGLALGAERGMLTPGLRTARAMTALATSLLGPR